MSGVDHVVKLTMGRWGKEPAEVDSITPRANEVISVRNDRDHMERGMTTLDIRGSRE